MAVYTVETEELFTYIETGPLTTATITDLVHHVTGRGYAKLNVVDRYDEEFGIDLAGSRAMERLHRKLQRVEKRAQQKMIKSLG